MKKQLKKTVLEQANVWIESDQKVVLARVIHTWGSSPCPTGSSMIINEKGDFFGSVSGPSERPYNTVSRWRWNIKLQGYRPLGVTKRHI